MWYPLLRQAARNHPDKLAFVESWSGKSITFRDLETRAVHYADRLVSHGLVRGDTVVFMGDASIDLVVALLGHYFAGVTHAPINTRYGIEEVRHIVADSGARLAVIDPPYREIMRAAAPNLLAWDTAEFEFHNASPADLADPDDEEIALLIYTSGTTGKSKGVELSFRAVAANISALTDLWRWTPQDRLVLALPLFHVHGLAIGIHGTLIQGCTTELHKRFDAAAVVNAMADTGTLFMGVPTMYAMILRHLEQHPDLARSLGRARLFTSGSAALSIDHFERFEALTGHRILERYGMSETLLTLSNPYEGQRRPGTVGLPVKGSEVEIFDDNGQPCDPEEIGEIAVRGLSLMTGYRNQPEATTAAFRDGWFMTGDVASKSHDGYFRIVGRASTDIIKSGGFKVSAREIEEVLSHHPDVREIAVVGIDDEVWGERIGAAVVLNGPPDMLNGPPDRDILAALQAFGRERLADYKQLRDVRVVDELPRNAMGKVQKNVIKSVLFAPTPPLQPNGEAES